MHLMIAHLKVNLSYLVTVQKLQSSFKQGKCFLMQYITHCLICSKGNDIKLAKSDTQTVSAATTQRLISVQL